MRIAIIFWLVFGMVFPVTAAHAEPETLSQAWSYAYQINPSLQAERAGLRATDEAVSQAQTHWRPNIQATGNLGKTYQYLPAQQQFGTANFSDTTRGYNVQVTQPLFRGWRTDSETDAAEKQVLAGRAKLSDAEQQLFLDTTKAFLDAVRDEATLDIQRENEHVLEQKLTETRARSQLGELTQTDVHQAESRLERSRVSRYQAESALTNDRASYLRLVGHLPEKLNPPDLRVDASRSREDILQLADTRNPKVLAAQYDSDEAKEEVTLNKGALLPELDIVGNSGKNWGESSTLPGRFDSDQVLLQLTIPLYDSGTTYSKTRAAEQTATQKRMTLEETRHKAHETADNAWEGLRESEAALKADKSEVEASAKAYDGVKIQSKVGTRTTLDVLNAEQEWLDAKVDLLKSQHDRDLAILQIVASIGQLTTDYMMLPVKRYDPEQHYHDVRNQWVGFSKDDERYDPCASDDASACPAKQEERSIKTDSVAAPDNIQTVEVRETHAVPPETQEAAP
jgi:outer membrane protein